MLPDDFHAGRRAKNNSGAIAALLSVESGATGASSNGSSVRVSSRLIRSR